MSTISPTFQRRCCQPTVECFKFHQHVLQTTVFAKNVCCPRVCTRTCAASSAAVHLIAISLGLFCIFFHCLPPPPPNDRNGVKSDNRWKIDEHSDLCALFAFYGNIQADDSCLSPPSLPYSVARGLKPFGILAKMTGLKSLSMYIPVA